MITFNFAKRTCYVLLQLLWQGEARTCFYIEVIETALSISTTVIWGSDNCCYFIVDMVDFTSSKFCVWHILSDDQPMSDTGLFNKL